MEAAGVNTTRRFFVEPSPDRVDTETAFRLGAVSETLMAVVVGALVKGKLIAWEDRVTRRLPELGTLLRVIREEDEIAGTFTFAPREPAITPDTPQSYWDRRTIRDLVHNRCDRLPPTEAGLGVHEFPILGRAGLMRTIRYFTENDLAVSSFERERSERTAFSYALLALVLEGCGAPKHRQGIWHAFFTDSLVKLCMTTMTTISTKKVAKHGNMAHSRRLTSGRISEDRNGFDLWVSTARWAGDASEVFAPARGAWSNMDDMITFCARLLRILREHPEDCATLFAPPIPGQEQDRSDPQLIGWDSSWAPVQIPMFQDNPVYTEQQTGQQQFSLGQERAGYGILEVRLHQSISQGSDHQTAVAIVPDLDLAVIVLSDTGSRVPFAGLVTQLVLERVGGLRPIDLDTASLDRRRLGRSWYLRKMIDPWMAGRDLQRFFHGFAPADAPMVAFRLREMSGRYVNAGLRRSITLTATPMQMALFVRQLHWREIDLHWSVNTWRGEAGGNKSHRQLELLACICQMSMTLGPNRAHQRVTLLPYRGESNSETWSYLPLSERRAAIAGLSHYRKPEQTLVRAIRSPTQGIIVALEVDIGGRLVRFDKDIRDINTPQPQRDHKYWSRRIRRDYLHLSPTFMRERSQSPLPPVPAPVDMPDADYLRRRIWNAPTSF